MESIDSDFEALMIARYYLVFVLQCLLPSAVSFVVSALDLRRTISLRKRMADHCLSASRVLPVMESLLLFV